MAPDEAMNACSLPSTECWGYACGQRRVGHRVRHGGPRRLGELSTRWGGRRSMWERHRRGTEHWPSRVELQTIWSAISSGSVALGLCPAPFVARALISLGRSCPFDLERALSFMGLASHSRRKRHRLRPPSSTWEMSWVRLWGERHAACAFGGTTRTGSQLVSFDTVLEARRYERREEPAEERNSRRHLVGVQRVVARPAGCPRRQPHSRAGGVPLQEQVLDVAASLVRAGVRPRAHAAQLVRHVYRERMRWRRAQNTWS